MSNQEKELLRSILCEMAQCLYNISAIGEKDGGALLDKIFTLTDTLEIKPITGKNPFSKLK